MVKLTNADNISGDLSDAIKGADIFIGTSAPKILTKKMVASMAEKSIVYACANPVPEIFPDEAKMAGAYIVATGRSDFANQVNNVLAFPGIFKGAFAARATDITEDMKLAAAKALASMVKNEELSPDYIIPSPFKEGVAQAVADAVAKA